MLLCLNNDRLKKNFVEKLLEMDEHSHRSKGEKGDPGISGKTLYHFPSCLTKIMNDLLDQINEHDLIFNRFKR